MLLVRHIVALVAVGFLDAATIERMQTARLQAERPARFPDGVEHMPRHVGRRIDFPAEFANEGDAVGPHARKAQLDLLHGAERERSVGEVG